MKEHYIIHRVEKVKLEQVTGIEHHHFRDKKLEQTHSLPNEERNKFIYIKNDNNEKITIREKIKNILTENGIEKYRSDAVVCLDQIYTYSPDKMKDYIVYLHQDLSDKRNQDFFGIDKTGNVKEYRTEEQRLHYSWLDSYNPNNVATQKAEFEKFAQYCMSFAQRHYGEIIGAEIHVDEASPHLHVQTVPLIKEKEKNRLSAKEIIGNKSKMSKTQTDLFEEVGRKFGLKRGNEKSQSKHIENAKKRLEEIENDVKNALEDVDPIFIRFAKEKAENEKKTKIIKDILKKYPQLEKEFEKAEILDAFLSKE